MVRWEKLNVFSSFADILTISDEQLGREQQESYDERRTNYSVDARKSKEGRL